MKEPMRLAALKQQLQQLRYDQPLGVESAPLVERLLEDLMASQAKQAELSGLAEKRADELSVAEQHILPVRKENQRLVRENNELHMQLIADAEAAASSREALADAAGSLQKQNADLRFITSQQQSRIDALQQENDALRARFHDALVQNGIVLPSGHEVRWHGRKEHMKAHSPVGAASDDAVAKSAEEAAAQIREGVEMESELEDIIAAGGVAVEPIAAARQVRAAAVQASHLQKRLDDATKKTSDLESQLAAAAEKAEQRDRELARLQAQASARGASPALSVAHVSQEKNLTIAQLNHQVDFLNSQCAEQAQKLEAAEAAAAATAKVEADLKRMTNAVHELRTEKAALHDELLRAQASSAGLHGVGHLSDSKAPQTEKQTTARTGDIGDGGVVLDEHLDNGRSGGSGSDEGALSDLRSRLGAALSALARERAARAAAEATDVGDVYAAYQSDKAALSRALDLVQQEKAGVEGQLEVAKVAEAAAVNAANDEAAKRKEAESALSVAAKDAKTFAETAASLRAERDGLEKRAIALDAELQAVSAAVIQHETANESLREQLQSLRAEAQSLKATSAEASSTIDAMRQEVRTQQGSLSDLRHQLTDADDQRQNLQHERERLAELLRAERASSASTRAELEQLKEAGLEREGTEGALSRALEAERAEAVRTKQATRAAEAQVDSLRRRVAELEETAERLRESQATLEDHRSVIATTRAELRAANLATERLEAEMAVHISEATAHAQALHSASSERDLIKSSLANTEAQLRTAHAQLGGFRDERERLTAAHAALKAKLASEREASRMQILETQRATASVKRLEAELDEASKRLTIAEGERTQHEALVREMREQAERAREQLDEARAALAAETEARQTEASAREQAQAAYEEERDGRQTCIRSQHEMEKSQRRTEDLLREREADVSQLKALVARMELAHSELAAKLESAQVRLADAQSGKSTETEKRERLAAELHDANQALASLRELVGSLDRERDALASQVDQKAEEATALRHQADKALNSAAEAERQLLEAQEQASRQAELLANLEKTRAATQARLDEVSRAESAMRASSKASEEELANVADDLGKMIKENQFLNDELQKGARHAERSQREVRQLEAKAAQLQAAVEAAHEEKEEMLRSYRRQAEEVSAVRVSMTTVADERDALRSQLALLEEGYAELQGQSGRVQAENAQLLLDLHAFESQNDALVRQLEAADGEFRAAAAEKQAAEQQLASTQLVLGGIERSREMIQRDSASASRAMHGLRVELEQAEKDRGVLRQQLELARGQVEQLEAVAADLRNKAVRQTPVDAADDKRIAAPASGAEGGSSVEGAAELTLLRQQTAKLSSEVESLQRALGTAAQERDAALLAQKEIGAREASLQETVASQAAVIRTLDDERSAALRAAGS